MPTYKLSYYDGRARGEPARMLFALKGQAFEDVRYEFGGQEWPKVKGDKKKFPFGSMPVLEVYGKPLTQSHAIYRYLAREFGYYGNNNQESAEIDEIMGIIGDMEIALSPAYEEQDEAKRKAFLIKGRDTTLKLFYEFFVEKLEKSGGKFFVGNRLTLADLVVFNVLDFFLDTVLGFKDYLGPYPSLHKYYQTIKTDSPLSPYLKARKVTPL